MKLYSSIGPNPKVIQMFIKERGIEVETVEIDIIKGANRESEHLLRNPSGQSPTLELDNGMFLSEITAICEYFDEAEGQSDLIGTDAESRAETRMWTRRIDLNIVEPLTNGFRFSEGLPMFSTRLRTMPQAADDLKTLAQEKLTWLDQLIEGKTFICGERFTLADILLFCFLEFGNNVGQPLNAENKNIAAWYARVADRSSAAA